MTPVPLRVDPAGTGSVTPTLSVRWHARLQPDISAGFLSYSPDEGEAYAVYRLEFSLPESADGPVEFRPTDGLEVLVRAGRSEWYTGWTLTGIEASYGAEEVTLDPGDSTTGVVPFAVPRRARNATLHLWTDDEASPLGFDVTCAPSLDVL